MSITSSTVSGILKTKLDSLFLNRTFELNGGNVTLVSIPRFSKTRSLVMVNLRTLEAKEVSFGGNPEDMEF